MAGLSPLTGNLVMRPLSPSTRSGSGPTGDFFKPRAFFAFFGDPGSKPKSDSVVFSLSYAIFSPFWNFQTYRVFDPEIGFPHANVLPLFIFSILFLTYLVKGSSSRYFHDLSPSMSSIRRSKSRTRSFIASVDKESSSLAWLMLFRSLRIWK